MLSNKQIDQLIGVSESFHASYKLMEIVLKKEEREKLFNEFMEIETDLSIDWFTDYFQSEHADRKQKMQDFTPDSIVQICSEILGETKSNADVCSGIGGLTIKRWWNNQDATFYCEEFSDRAIPFLLFNLAIRNISGQVKHGDVLTNKYKAIYRLSKGEIFSDIELVDNHEDTHVDTVVMNPPYSQDWKPVYDERFVYGLAPKSKADYAFLLHGFDKLNNDGTQAIILPHGVLFRGGSEKNIRKHLIENNHLDAVIGLPAKVFLNTDIPTVILVLKKHRVTKDILFIDAKDECVKGRKNNEIEPSHIERIVDVYKNRKEVERFSHLATYQEVTENDFNLNIPRYVDTFIEEPTIPLDQLMVEMKEIDEQKIKTKQELATMMLDLKGSNPESDRMIKDFAKYFAETNGIRPVEYKSEAKREVATKQVEEIPKERQANLFDCI